MEYPLTASAQVGSAYNRHVDAQFPQITAATFTLNFKRADDTYAYTELTTLVNRAGLYQWDPDLTPAAYTEGLFGAFPVISDGLVVQIGNIYRVGAALYTPKSDFTVAAATLPPDGASVAAHWDSLVEMGLTHYDGGGSPTTPPTAAGQSYVNDDGLLWVSGDRRTVEVGPAITSLPFATDSFFQGFDVDGDDLADGQFTWLTGLGVVTTSAFFRQRRGQNVALHDWEALWTYIQTLTGENTLENQNLAGAVFLGSFNSNEDVADQLSRRTDASTNNFYYILLGGWLRHVENYIPNATTHHDVLFWRGPFITLDDVRSHAAGLNWTDLGQTPDAITAGQIVVANAAGDALVFSLRDIIYVDHTPPEPTAANERNIIIARISGSLWTQKQETIHGTAPQATWGTQTYADVLGAFYNPPAPQANHRYYNIGIDVWFRANTFAGQTLWEAGGEPDDWRGQAPTEEAAASNNADAVGDVVYIVNRNQFRITLTWTPGTDPSIRREWVNQRDLGAQILLPEADGNLRVATIDDVDRTIAIRREGIYLAHPLHHRATQPTVVWETVEAELGIPSTLGGHFENYSGIATTVPDHFYTTFGVLGIFVYVTSERHFYGTVLSDPSNPNSYAVWRQRSDPEGWLGHFSSLELAAAAAADDDSDDKVNFWAWTGSRVQRITAYSAGTVGTTSYEWRLAGGGDGSEDSGVVGDLIATLQFADTEDTNLPLPQSSGTEVSRTTIGTTSAPASWAVADGIDNVSTYVANGIYTRLKIPRMRPDANVGGFVAESYNRPLLGTIDDPGLAIDALEMILVASAPSLAVGDFLRIENEEVEVTTVPSVGSTGVAARTYSISRGEGGTTAIAHGTDSEVRRNALVVYHQTDFEWGPGNIYHQGQVATAVSALKMDTEATVQLRYIADEDADNFHIDLYSRDGQVARGSEIRLHWKVEGGGCRGGCHYQRPVHAGGRCRTDPGPSSHYALAGGRKRAFRSRPSLAVRQRMEQRQRASPVVLLSGRCAHSCPTQSGL